MFIVKTQHGEVFETASLKDAYSRWLEYGGIIEERRVRGFGKKIPTPTTVSYRIISQSKDRGKGSFLCSGFTTKTKARELAEKLNGKILEHLTVNDFTVSIREVQ